MIPNTSQRIRLNESEPIYIEFPFIWLFIMILSDIYRRFVDSANVHISKFINIYSCLGVLTMTLIYISPLLMWERRLPYFMYVPFGIEETNVGFFIAYLYQLGNDIYAGGLNITVNMYLFSMFIFITYSLSLLSSRMRRFGYSSGFDGSQIENPVSRKSLYREMCGFIKLHVKIDE